MSVSVGRRSLKLRAAGTLVALGAALTIMVVPHVSSAAPAPSGPLFPPPGGVTTAVTPTEGTPPNDGYIGKAGGSTVTYSAFSSSAGLYSHMWWGPDGSQNSPAFAFDGTVDNLTFGGSPATVERLNGLALSPSGNSAIWGMGTSTLKYIVSGTYTNKVVNTRFRMVATTNPGNVPINWVSASTAGVSSAVGAVIPVPISGGVPQSFKVIRIFEACSPNFTQPNVATCNASDANWEPVNVMYDRLNTDPGVRTISSIATGFFYNRIPTVSSQSPTVSEDTALGITLGASDPDGNALTYSIVSGPAHGTISPGSGASRTYSPALNYNGPDSFTFKVNDGFADSATATVSITVNPVNDAPVATPRSVTTDEDTALDVALGGTDVDGDPLTFAIATSAGNGTVNLTGSTATYTPASNFNGTDSFTFRANDGTVFSAPATVTITVNPVNDAPVAQDLTVGTDEDTERDITLVAADVDLGDTLSYSIVQQPSHGTLTPVSGATFHYAPDDNYNSSIAGDDSFTFKAIDAGSAESNVATVTIQIPAVNDQPVAQNQSVTTDEDTSLPILLAATDIDEDPLTYSVVDGPSHGHLEGAGQSLVYVPDENFNGQDSFTFTAFDGTVDSVPATISITVNAVNDAPVADAQSLTTAEDTPLGITLTGSDVDGDALTFSIVDGPANGTLQVNGASVTYTPDLNYNGPDQFTFKVTDGALEAVETILITVTPVNDAPVADAQAVSTNEDTPLAIVLGASDVDGDSLSYTIVSGPTHGSVEIDGTSVIYTPFQDYNGSDSFVFEASDGALSGTATIDITVDEVNDAPVAEPDTATTPQYTPVTIPVLLNDSDVDLDTFQIVSATPGTKGTTTVNTADGTITYTPTPQFKDSDAFTYVISDGQATASATVVITEEGCGEDGVDHASGGPADGAASKTIDREVEPRIGEIDPDTAATVHAYNCATVVPAENTIDETLP